MLVDLIVELPFLLNLSSHVCKMSGSWYAVSSKRANSLRDVIDI